jgi:hypothetical protein
VKKDRFKEYVYGHRHEFELEAPEKEELWDLINSQIKREKKAPIGIWKIMGIAASLLLIATSIFILRPNQSMHQADGPLSEFVETQEFYKGQIDSYSVQLTSYDPQFASMFDSFDEEYKRLEGDLKLTGDIEVLEKMIEVQRAKLQALRALLDEIKVKEERHDLDL